MGGFCSSNENGSSRKDTAKLGYGNHALDECKRSKGCGRLSISLFPMMAVDGRIFRSVRSGV